MPVTPLADRTQEAPEAVPLSSNVLYAYAFLIMFTSVVRAIKTTWGDSTACGLSSIPPPTGQWEEGGRVDGLLFTSHKSIKRITFFCGLYPVC